MGKKWKEWYLFLLLCAVVMAGFVCLFLSHLQDNPAPDSRISSSGIQRVVLDLNSTITWPKRLDCTYARCFHVYKCTHDTLSVYMYPLGQFVDGDAGVVLNPAPSR